MRNLVLEEFKKYGTLVQPDAMEYVLSKEDPISFVNALIKKFDNEQTILTLDTIHKIEHLLDREFATSMGDYRENNNHGITLTYISERTTTEQRMEETQKNMHFFVNVHKCTAKDYEGEIKIVRDIKCKQTIELSGTNFAKYFMDRYNRIKRMLINRIGSNNIVRMNDLREGEVKVIGIVRDVKDTRKGHTIVELEDDTGECVALIPRHNKYISDTILHDEVIGIIGTFKNDLILVNDIVRPGIPFATKFHTSNVPLAVAFISDLHVGSNTFLSNEWKKFVEWLRCDDATQIKYLVISGDVVDGIGVYPNQEYDLCIEDIYQQYETVSKLFDEIPEYIKIIMLPGNHDLVRPGEPQPTFPDEIIKLFDRDITFVGNPCWFRLDGVEILAYHGRSMDDFISRIQWLRYDQPIPIMIEMLKRRHLAPIYGDKTPIIPELQDNLVIESVPNIFVTGHIHSFGTQKYNGIILVNASTWQSQTAYQLMRNFKPQPARVAIVELNTGNTRVKNFL